MADRSHTSRKPAGGARPYVFLSYAREDAAFVDRLAADLEHAGVDVWRDTERIAPGMNWQRSLGEALNRAAALLLVLSANTLASSWVSREVAAVVDRGDALVLPVVIDDAGALLPQDLSAIQWVDFRGGYERGLEVLLDALPEELRQAHAVPSKTELSKGYVFLSYADEDAPFVAALKQFLSEHGYAYWDYRESERDYQLPFLLELESVIIEAEATLSILSPAWKASGTAFKEYRFSDEIGKPVFLLRAEPMGPTLAIAGIPYIDFVADQSAGFKELHRELRRKGL